MPGLKLVDNLDCRREIWRCMELLTKQQRIEFLEYCCRSIGILGFDQKTKSPVIVTVQNNTGEVAETYLDMMAMISGYGLDADKALAELERRASAMTTPFKIYVPE